VVFYQIVLKSAVIKVINYLLG